MAYKYDLEKEKLFTDNGQKVFLKVRDHVQRCLKMSGVVIMEKAMSPPGGSGSANTWTNMACVDRLVELGEIREIKYGDCAGQHRIFAGK